MIRIDLIWAMAGFLGIGMVLVFVFWMFYNFTEEKTPGGIVEQCPYCTYIFLNDRPDNAVQCPRCRSLVTPANGGGKVS